MQISKAILKEMGACTSGLRSFVQVHGDAEITFAQCVESGSNSISDYLWFIGKQSLSDSQLKDVKLFAVWCAKQVSHLYTHGPEVDAAIAAAEKAILDPTDENKRAAADAARAAYAADAARAARAAADAAQRAELLRVVKGWE